MPFPPLSLQCPPTALRHHECRVDETFFFIQRAIVAKLVGDIHRHSPQNLDAAPSPKASMHGFVVGIALRKHVPLRTGVENPQRCFKHTTRGNRLAARSTVRDVVVRKMVSDASSPIVGQSKHPTFIDDRARSAILR